MAEVEVGDKLWRVNGNDVERALKILKRELQMCLSTNKNGYPNT
jgi:ribosomal protein S21